MSDKNYFYHVVPLKQVRRSVIVADASYSDPEYLPAYHWLEKELGFFPLFLAVGGKDAISVTGYQNQWRVRIGGQFENGQYRPTYRRAGEFENFVLFAFPLDAVEGTFNDYQWWNIVLTEAICEREVGPGMRKLLFKRSWSRAKWLATARKDGHLVQLVAPQIDLARAEFVWARNRKSAEALRQLGFENVQVQRLTVDS